MENLKTVSRREAYECDILYGTNNEFGFDYLRDNMVIHKENMVQDGHPYAIIDEVDSILIDEARTPLIISGISYKTTELYKKFSQITPRLEENEDFRDYVNGNNANIHDLNGFNYGDDPSKTRFQCFNKFSKSKF